MKFTYTSGSRPLEGYTIKRGVGHGGFGEVYYAVSDGGKEVALKLVQRNLDIELRGVAQCMNLKHPNLVTLYDLRSNDAGEQWVIMEYVAGKSLADVLEEHPTGLPTADVHRWLKGIAAGVGYLHDKGIVHRDLKPGNLFLEDGVVKVGDYGLSKFITASRRSGQTESVGTVHYMAPEICKGKYDREIDIYAAGVILYEILSGDVPFDGESVGEILMKHLTAQPDVARLPAPYDRIAARALAKDPAERYRTMDELAASLNGQRVESVAADDQACGTDRETAAYAPVQAPAAPPSSAREHGEEPFADWCARQYAQGRARFTSWWRRPWGPLDYLIAVPLAAIVIAVAMSLVHFVVWAGVVMFFPFALIGLVALFVIRAVTGPRRHGLAPPPRMGPVVLNPVAAPLRAAPAAAAPAAPPPPRNPVAPPPPRLRPAIAPRAALRRSELPPKSNRVRLAEAISAMLLAAVLSVVAGVFAAGLLGLPTPQQGAWLAATTLAGCWAVIVPGKLWEGAKGDGVPRRLAMGLLGLGVGFWSGYLAGLLGIDAAFAARTVPAHAVPGWLSPAGVRATFFALAFVVPAWWRLADSRRSLRFNPWSVIVPAVWAYLITLVWDYPQPLGAAVIGLVALIVQLASPWDDGMVGKKKNLPSAAPGGNAPPGANFNMAALFFIGLAILLIGGVAFMLLIA